MKLRKKLNFIFSRKITVIILLAIQVILVGIFYFRLSEQFTYFYIGMTVLAIVIVMYIATKNENPSYKVAWLVPFVVFPGFMALTYVFLKAQLTRHFFKKEVQKRLEKTKPYLKQSAEITDAVKSENNPFFEHLSSYINEYGGYPTYQNTGVSYYKCGEDWYEVLKDELRKAEHFIYIEYFIVEKGVMFDSILDILKKKADEGVDIKFIYDGIGAQTILPGSYDETLTQMGIKTKVFNPFVPFLSSAQNNRDHRKIFVIDGHTAFTGGTNLADEYINAVEKYGYWKDSAVMLKGDAVWSFTIMFHQMWELGTQGAGADYMQLAPHKYCDDEFESDGFVIPYGDSPLDDETVGRIIYLDIITKAKDYIYITAPYLILDSELETAICYAAKSGVKVVIIVPGITDKWYVHKISQCYYKTLLENGVKFYEYKPGFIHAKNVVSDDNIATCGTVNFDFRSLYLHFEDGVVMYKNSAVRDIKHDFETTLKEDCREITLEEINKRNIFDKLFSNILKVFGPLL